MNFWILIGFCIFNIILPSKLLAGDIALIVTIDPGLLGGGPRSWQSEDQIKKVDKNVEILKVNGYWPGAMIIPTSLFYGEAETKKSAAAIDSQIRDLIAAGKISNARQIQHLIIQTHGSTDEKEAGSITSLTGIGKIGESEVDENFNRAFEGLIPYVKDNLNIIFNSCSVFCGSKDSAISRSKTLTHFFRTTSAKIYGAHTFETSGERANPFLNSRLRSLLPENQATITIFILVQTAATLITYKLGGDDIRNLFTTDGLISIPLSGAGSWFISLGLDHFFLRPITYLLTALGLINRGYLAQFKNGNLESMRQVKKFYNLKALYATGTNICSKIF